MADVSVDASVVTATARGLRSVVFTTDQIGYCFYIDSDGTFAYSKTTDGGATWGARVQIATNTTYIAFDVWYDRWTPGDTTGNFIYYWRFDSTSDAVEVEKLRTTDDVRSYAGTVLVGASAVAGRGAFVSGCKTRSGYLYCAYDIDAGAERGFHRLTSGTTWSANLSTTFVEATLDTCSLFPASGTGDDNDCWALYYDASALALTLKLWDSSAVAQVESATIGVAHTDGPTDLTGQFGYSGSVRHSDGHLIVAALSGRDVAASTHQVFDITSTSTITTKTAIAASTDDHYYPQVYIDQSTDAIYVAYNGKRDGSEVMDTTTKVYYVKSTDGGATWSSGDTAYMEGTAGVVAQVWTPLMGLRFYATWRVGTTLLGNAVNSVSTPSGPAAQGVTGTTIASTAQRFAPTVVPDAVTVVGATLGIGSSANPPTVTQPSADQAVTGTTLGIGSAVTAPTIAVGAVTVTGATLTSGLQVRVPTVTVGAVTITGTTLAVGSSVTAPTVGAGAVTVTGATLTSGIQVRTPTVTAGAVTVTGATLTSGSVVRVPSVTVGAVTVIGATLGPGSAVSAPTVTTGAVTITGATRATTTQVFAPAISGTGAIGGATLSSSLHLYAPIVSGGAVPVGVVSNTPYGWLV